MKSIRLCIMLIILSVTFAGAAVVEDRKNSTPQPAPVPATAPPFPANDGYYQKSGNGSINWDSGVITATGTGTAPSQVQSAGQSKYLAVRAATVIARRNLLETIKGVQIDSVTTVENQLVQNDSITQRVQGYLQNSMVLNTTYLPDGSAEVMVGVNLHDGRLGDMLVPRTIPFNPQYAPAPLPEVTKADAATPNAPYTGLIIDARGFDARPAMAPRVMDEAGNEVYGSGMIGREYAISQGMVGYAKDAMKAMSNSRIGAKPFVAKAVAVSGKAKTDPIVSNETAMQIKEMTKNNNFLEKCRVMIVLD